MPSIPELPKIPSPPAVSLPSLGQVSSDMDYGYGGYEQYGYDPNMLAASYTEPMANAWAYGEALTQPYDQAAAMTQPNDQAANEADTDKVNLDADIKKNMNVIMSHMAKQVPMQCRPLKPAQQEKMLKEIMSHELSKKVQEIK